MRPRTAVSFVWHGMTTRRTRIGLTTLGVALGVALVVGMSVITSSLYSSLTSLTVEIYGGAQLVVVPSATGGSLDTRTLALTRRAPGVARVDGVVYFPARRARGSARGQAGAVGDRLTVVGVTRTGVRDAVGLAGVHVTQGRAPIQGAEIALERTWATRNRLRLGDQVALAAPAGVVRLRLVGTFVLPPVADLLGQSFAAMPLPAARAAAHHTGFDELTIVMNHNAPTEPARQFLQAGLGASVKVESPAQRADALAAQLAVLKVVVAVLTAMGLIVAGFLTRSCFVLTTYERQREFGILRAIGASGATIGMLVLIEALLIGLVASAAGLALGLLAARGLVALAPGSGYSLTAGSLPHATLLIAVLGGALASTAGAVGPAVLSARCPPLSSLGARGSGAASPQRRWSLAGGALLVAGLVGCYVAAAPAEQVSTARLVVAILSLALVFNGAALVVPAAVEPLTRMLAWPLGRRGRPEAYLAAGAVTWSPRRSATTAAVVMLGVALTVTAGTLASSVIRSVSDQLAYTEKEDFSVQPRTFNQLSLQPRETFSDRLRAAIAGLPGAGVVTPQRMVLSTTVVRGQTTLVSAVDPAAFSRVGWIDMEQGSADRAIAGLAQGQVIIGDGLARTRRLRVGQTMIVAGSRAAIRATIDGVEHNLLNNGNQITISLGLMQRAFGVSTDSLLDIDARTPTEVASLRRAVDGLLARDYPQLLTRSPGELTHQVDTQLSSAEYAANLLMLLIATISIVAVITTLTLSIVERTRELGVLRAIGLSMDQLQSSVRLESVALCLMGAICGIAVGLALGFAMVAGLARSIPSLAYAPPALAVAGALVWAVLLGLVAATPALRRATRIGITAAIAYE